MWEHVKGKTSHLPYYPNMVLVEKTKARAIATTARALLTSNKLLMKFLQQFGPQKQLSLCSVFQGYGTHRETMERSCGGDLNKTSLQIKCMPKWWTCHLWNILLIILKPPFFIRPVSMQRSKFVKQFRHKPEKAMVNSKLQSSTIFRWNSQKKYKSWIKRLIPSYLKKGVSVLTI